MTEYYKQGFIAKCAEYGVDGTHILKKANILGKGSSMLGKFIGNLTGSRVGALEKRLASVRNNFLNKHIFVDGKSFMGPGESTFMKYVDNSTRLNNLLEKARKARDMTRLATGVGGAGLGGLLIGRSTADTQEYPGWYY